MKTGAFAPLSGEVDADETFVGGKHQHLPTRMNAGGRNVPIGGPAAGKTTVIGMFQRGNGMASHALARWSSPITVPRL